MTDKPKPDASASKRRRISIGVVIGLTLISGVVHGNLHGRWNRAKENVEIGQQLHELPERCGDWVMTESLELPDYALTMLRCHGSAVRRYRNEKTNASVSVTVLFGPRGPTAVHTPEVCFASTGIQQVGKREVETVRAGDGRHELWSAKFSRKPSPEAAVDAWWAWSEGGNWETDNHRYGLTANLYKIQVSGAIGDEFQQPCREFLEAFLPEVQKVVVPTK